MNQNMKFLAIVLLSFVLTNCTIQKRTINKGYFVQWNCNKKVISNQNTNHSITKTSENQDTLNLIFSNEITEETLLNVKDEVLNQSTSLPEKKVKDNEIEFNSYFDLDKTEFKTNSKLLTHLIKKQKHNLKTLKEKKATSDFEDYGISIHILLTTALAIFLLGVVLIIRGLSTNYINFAFILGVILSFAGIILFLISLIKIINWSIKRKKNKEQISESTRKKYKIFKSIEIGLVIAFLILLIVLSSI